MATEGFKRKLAAVFSADVAGYSRLMGEDEAATLTTLEAYKQVMSVLIKQHRGRVVASPGDNILAEFASVVDAVQCGVAVQKEIQARNAEFPESRRMQFRIGINLGDVIEEEDSIYGDGVNIAARLESLADPGGICVSKTAFEHIEAKLPFGYEFLGEQTVKNIAKPVGTYKVLMEPRVTVKSEAGAKPRAGASRKPLFAALLSVFVLAVGAAAFWYFTRPPSRPPVEKASAEKMAFPLPDVPSIAVLPFVNMSKDPDQEFLCDGMSEAIITALSKVPGMFVIARNSTFKYKGKPVEVKQISEELGVRYVLEGSLQRSGDRVRITAQLIDALKGDHLWAESYDRDLKDIFALQDEITRKILAAAKVKLIGGDVAAGETYEEKYFKGKQGLDCYLKLMQASAYLQPLHYRGYQLGPTNHRRGYGYVSRESLGLWLPRLGLPT
jgi:adenylate cyclase